MSSPTATTASNPLSLLRSFSTISPISSKYSSRSVPFLFGGGSGSGGPAPYPPWRRAAAISSMASVRSHRSERSPSIRSHWAEQKAYVQPHRVKQKASVRPKFCSVHCGRIEGFRSAYQGRTVMFCSAMIGRTEHDPKKKKSKDVKK